MLLDQIACYAAVQARDRRFDGVFFTGVKTTGIYCRPVCPAATPKQRNCMFFETAAAAEEAGFRPCLRCRPELSPYSDPMNGKRELAQQVLRRIHADGLFDTSLESLASQFGVSSRHMRRVVEEEYGVSPIRLVRTHRLLFARKLLRQTMLPITEVAFASGFSSLARFNALFRQEYGEPPSRIRREVRALPDGQSLKLRLAYREPFDWRSLLDYLAPRCWPGVETIDGDCYRRTVRMGERSGWVCVRQAPEAAALDLTVSDGLAGCLLSVVGKLRRLFDLDANPALIEGALARDPDLTEAIAQRPGLRVPGAFDGLELAVRAILGQQVTVNAAHTLASRLAKRFAPPLTEPVEGLSHWPLPAAELAAIPARDIAAIGLPLKRAEAIRRIALCVANREVDLDHSWDIDVCRKRLAAIPGVGDWTAEYIVMRALHWPDAFPAGDLGLRKALGAGGPLSRRATEGHAEAWRPWRSYAAMHLWLR